MLLLFIAPNAQVGVSLGLIVCVSGFKGVSITVPLTIYIVVCVPQTVGHLSSITCLLTKYLL